MSRPVDGLCRACHRPLPKEQLRDWLTQGTDRCAKCGHAAAEREARTPPGRRYFMSWPQVLDTHLRVMARVR